MIMRRSRSESTEKILFQEVLRKPAKEGKRAIGVNYSLGHVSGGNAKTDIDYGQNKEESGQSDGGIDQEFLKSSLSVVPTEVASKGRPEARTSVLKENGDHKKESDYSLSEKKTLHRNTQKQIKKTLS